MKRFNKATLIVTFINKVKRTRIIPNKKIDLTLNFWSKT